MADGFLFDEFYKQYYDPIAQEIRARTGREPTPREIDELIEQGVQRKAQSAFRLRQAQQETALTEEDIARSGKMFGRELGLAQRRLSFEEKQFKRAKRRFLPTMLLRGAEMGAGIYGSYKASQRHKQYMGKLDELIGQGQGMSTRSMLGPQPTGPEETYGLYTPSRFRRRIL